VRCPATLGLEHFFEGAMVGGAAIANELTLVPCSQSFDPPSPPLTQVELIVINEFEERRCGTFTVSCIGNIALAGQPLFSLGVQGTLSGHTRIRPIPGAETDAGHGLLAVALERHVPAMGNARSGAHQLSAQGVAEQADVIRTGSPGQLPLQRALGAAKPGKPSVPGLALEARRER
jgi:hypothetical protein